MVTVHGMGNGVYTSWAQNEGYDIPPTVSDVCRILKNPWEPYLHIAGLRIWVHGRPFPMADDYWDGNWLQVTVHCGAPGASVGVIAPILHVSEIAHFLRGVEAMYASLQGEATLPCMEPELAVTLTDEGLGHLTMVVAMTPDHLSQVVHSM